MTDVEHEFSHPSQHTYEPGDDRTDPPLTADSSHHPPSIVHQCCVDAQRCRQKHASTSDGSAAPITAKHLEELIEGAMKATAVMLREQFDLELAGYMKLFRAAADLAREKNHETAPGMAMAADLLRTALETS